MITAIPQVTNDSVKTACGNALTDDVTLAFFKNFLKSDYPYDRIVDDNFIYGSATEYNCSLTDWTTQANTGVLDTSETYFLMIRLRLKQVGGGVARLRVVEKNTLVNVTNWIYNRASGFPTGDTMKSISDSCYRESDVYTQIFLFVDVSAVDSIEMSIQLKQNGGTTAYYDSLYIHKQKYIYEKLED
jgi:hypothetical protein